MTDQWEIDQLVVRRANRPQNRYRRGHYASQHERLAHIAAHELPRILGELIARIEGAVHDWCPGCIDWQLFPHSRGVRRFTSS